MSHTLEAQDSESYKRTIAKLERDMGELLLSILRDPKTVEVMRNDDGKLWVERLGESMQCVGSLSSIQTRAILETVAACHGKVVTRESPIIEASLPLDGSRFAGFLPPISSSPIFAIRKRASAVFPLTRYVEQKIMTSQQHAALQAAVKNRKNILIVGGTGSGKTTFVNAIIDEIVAQNPKERLCTIEDTPEIQCAAENCVQVCESMHVDMTALLKSMLRMRPDRILVGEVRGPEALTLLNAWNTGHAGGVATVHANNAAAGLAKLIMLVSMHPNCPDCKELLIGEAVHVVVHITRTPNGSRRVEEILEVSGHENGRFLTQRLVEGVKRCGTF